MNSNVALNKKELTRQASQVIDNIQKSKEFIVDFKKALLVREVYLKNEPYYSMKTDLDSREKKFVGAVERKFSGVVHVCSHGFSGTFYGQSNITDDLKVVGFSKDEVDSLVKKFAKKLVDNFNYKEIRELIDAVNGQKGIIRAVIGYRVLLDDIVYDAAKILEKAYELVGGKPVDGTAQMSVLTKFNNWLYRPR